MKKGLIGSAALLVLGYFGVSFFFGGEAEDQFKKSIRVVDEVLQDKMQQIPTAPRVNLLVKEYKKGLVSSSAKLAFKVDLSDLPLPVPGPMKKLSYDLPLKINHGPFILPLAQAGMAYVEASVKLPKKAVKKARMQLSKDSTLPHMDFSFLINFDESSVFKSGIPNFVLKPKQFPGKLIWKGMDMTYYISKNFMAVQGKSTLNGIDFTSPFANAQVSKIDVLSDLKATNFGLWVGSGSFNVPSISVSARGKSLFDLSKFSANSSANIDDGLLQAQMKLSLESIKSMGQTFGPANMDFSLKKIDAAALVKLQSVIQQLKEGRKLSKEKQNMLTKQLDTLFPNVLSKGTELSLSKVSFKLPEGLISAALDVKLPAGNKAKKTMELVDYVQAKGYLKVPVILVEKQLLRQASRRIKYQQRQLSRKENQALTSQLQSQMVRSGTEIEPVKRLSRLEIKAMAKEKVDNQLKKLIDNELLIKENDTYLFKFTFDKGHLSVNGKPFSPEMLEQ